MLSLPLTRRTETFRQVLPSSYDTSTVGFLFFAADDPGDGGTATPMGKELPAGALLYRSSVGVNRTVDRGNRLVLRVRLDLKVHTALTYVDSSYGAARRTV